MERIDIKVYAGETKQIKVKITDKQKNPFNLTDYTAELRVKENREITNNESKIFKIGTIIDPESGEVLFSLTESDTNIPQTKYLYDIKISGEKVKIVAYGSFDVITPINRHE